MHRNPCSLRSLCPLLFLFAPEDLIDLWGSGALGKRELALWKSVCSVNSRIQQQAAWFWQVLEEEFDDELRSKVLQFATGTSSIGRDGLSAFRLEPGDGGDGPGWAGAMREERGLAAREFREQNPVRTIANSNDLWQSPSTAALFKSSSPPTAAPNRGGVGPAPDAWYKRKARQLMQMLTGKPEEQENAPSCEDRAVPCDASVTEEEGRHFDISAEKGDHLQIFGTSSMTAAVMAEELGITPSRPVDSIWKTVARLVKLALADPDRGWRAILLSCSVFVLLLGEVAAAGRYSVVQKNLITALQAKDKALFHRGLRNYLMPQKPKSDSQAAPCPYYALTLTGEIDNPDQRICQDVGHLVTSGVSFAQDVVRMLTGRLEDLLPAEMVS
eukprot:g29362.t1